MRARDRGTVVRASRTSPLDEPLPGAAEVRTPVTGIFAPGSTSEDTLQRGATVYSTATYYLPYGTDVVRTDRVEVMGRLWLVDGDPMSWANPASGRKAGLQVNLRSVRG